MNAPIQTCCVCSLTTAAVTAPDGLPVWTRQGLCRACASLGMDWASCRGCGKPIVWCETARGKKMPVDCRPPDGMPPNLVISAGQNNMPKAIHAHPEYIRLQVVIGSDLRSGVSHYATCPKVNNFRSKK